MILLPVFHATDKEDFNGGCCLGILALLAVSMVIKAIVVMLAWNYVAVDMLAISSTTINFWQALIVSFVLSLLTG